MVAAQRQLLSPEAMLQKKSQWRIFYSVERRRFAKNL
jgi:hypothetical protein